MNYKIESIQLYARELPPDRLVFAIGQLKAKRRRRFDESSVLLTAGNPSPGAAPALPAEELQEVVDLPVI